MTNNLEGIHPRLTHIIDLLDTMQICLTDTFRSAEEDLSEIVPFSAAEQIQQDWKPTFDEILEYLREDITVEPRKIICPRFVKEVSAYNRAAPWAAIETQADDDTEGGSASRRLRTK